MKRTLIIALIIVVVGVAAVFWLYPRRSDIPVANPLEGRVSPRPSDVPPSRDSQPRSFAAQDRPRVAIQTVPEESAGPITATAQITRGDGSVVEAKSLDGEFARILVQPNEVLTIRLALSGMDSNREVRIDADHGGSLNRQLGPLRVVPEPGQDAIEFQYAVGAHGGRYTLIVSQGQRQELFEFWVGPEPPTGRPGPVRVFNPDRVTGGRS
jgi:hypothetical protein